MNKKTNSINSLILFITAIFSAVVSVVLRCVNLFCFFDSDIGYYTSGAILPTVSNLLLLCFALFFIVFSFTTMKNKESDCSDAPRLYLRVTLGILIMILLSMALAFSYFNQKVQMNAPDKVLYGIACITSMIFTANDLKAAVGTKRNSTYNASAALTVLMGATASVPSLIAYYAGVLTTSDGMHLEYYPVLAMAIYAAIRLITSNASHGAKDIQEEAAAVTDTPVESETEASDTDITE